MRSGFTIREGARWMPEYLTAIDRTACNGLGRRFKVCSREVMYLYDIRREEFIE